MDYASLPPEINSGRMYVGPGAGPMLAAAAAWASLAAELQSTAALYESAIAGLTTGAWLGPASALMTAAVAPYVTWLRITAMQAEQTSNQAISAAAAYDAAFAATVPPPVVAANRTLLMVLVATNFFGQNTPTIAITETQYAEMWAQDAGAMLGYAGSSAAATSLTPFSEPAAITDVAGEASQAVAVAQAAGVSAGDAQSSVSNAVQALTAVPNTLSSLAAPAAAEPALTPLELLDIFDVVVGVGAVSTTLPLAIIGLPLGIAGYEVGLDTDDKVAEWTEAGLWPEASRVPFPVVPNPGTSVSAGLGEATSVGTLSVPAAWTTAAPEIRLAATALPVTSIGAAVEASAGGSLFSQMALAGMAGRAMAGVGAGGGGGGGGAGRRERIGERVGALTTKPKEPLAGEPEEPPSASTAPPLAGGPITSIATELRELAALRDSGILTTEEFTEQKRRLLAY